MNSRHFIAHPEAETSNGTNLHWCSGRGRPQAPTDVRFGSKADICGATSHVRFTPNSDRKSGHAGKLVGLLPGPKATSCYRPQPIADRQCRESVRSAKGHVCFGLKADVGGE